MSKKRQYKHYSPEFKEEAIALVTEQGYSEHVAFLLMYGNLPYILTSEWHRLSVTG